MKGGAPKEPLKELLKDPFKELLNEPPLSLLSAEKEPLKEPLGAKGRGPADTGRKKPVVCAVATLAPPMLLLLLPPSLPPPHPLSLKEPLNEALKLSSAAPAGGGGPSGLLP